ncbi:hypothetical protein [Acidianus sp. HS-5]|nr:hypothetical protein [Acidianus sp. HS-5]BDC17963.1 hypothetical protein HS5_08530 [Acidianus sp. HS-5]
MFEYYKRLEEINEDFEKNKDKYFKRIVEVTKNMRAGLTCSDRS